MSHCVSHRSGERNVRRVIRWFSYETMKKRPGHTDTLRGCNPQVGILRVSMQAALV